MSQTYCIFVQIKNSVCVCTVPTVLLCIIPTSLFIEVVLRMFYLSVSVLLVCVLEFCP